LDFYVSRIRHWSRTALLFREPVLGGTRGERGRVAAAAGRRPITAERQQNQTNEKPRLSEDGGCFCVCLFVARAVPERRERKRGPARALSAPSRENTEQLGTIARGPFGGRAEVYSPRRPTRFDRAKRET